MQNIYNKIHPAWQEFIDNNKILLDKIFSQIDFDNDIVYPHKNLIFKVLEYYGPAEIKLLLLGQDPYIGAENNIPQACGLSFSVPLSHKKIPPSLQNIFKEIKNCYPEFEIPQNGSLKRWCKIEKILLLNASLTVIEGKSNSHASLWKEFTDNLIKYISDTNENMIFLLMGNFAQQKAALINYEKHKIFTCVHPSPLSAHRGFLGCEIFKKINDYLIEINKEPINW